MRLFMICDVFGIYGMVVCYIVIFFFCNLIVYFWIWLLDNGVGGGVYFRWMEVLIWLWISGFLGGLGWFVFIKYNIYWMFMGFFFYIC